MYFIVEFFPTYNFKKCEFQKTKEEMQSPPREGAYIHGLFMEGARWDINIGSIVESKMKELHPMMPVMFIKALTQDKNESR